jgi:hypothetical protein
MCRGGLYLEGGVCVYCTQAAVPKGTLDLKQTVTTDETAKPVEE